MKNNAVIHCDLKPENVIFTDGDIVFERNPIPYMLNCIQSNTELLIQNDTQTMTDPKMCTGFFWIKCNEMTKQITNFETIAKKR